MKLTILQLKTMLSEATEHGSLDDLTADFIEGDYSIALHDALIEKFDGDNNQACSALFVHALVAGGIASERINLSESHGRRPVLSIQYDDQFRKTRDEDPIVEAGDSQTYLDIEHAFKIVLGGVTSDPVVQNRACQAMLMGKFVWGIAIASFFRSFVIISLEIDVKKSDWAE